jgi:hypothetical protein
MGGHMKTLDGRPLIFKYTNGKDLFAYSPNRTKMMVNKIEIQSRYTFRIGIYEVISCRVEAMR